MGGAAQLSIRATHVWAELRDDIMRGARALFIQPDNHSWSGRAPKSEIERSRRESGYVTENTASCTAFRSVIPGKYYNTARYSANCPFCLP